MTAQLGPENKGPNRWRGGLVNESSPLCERMTISASTDRRQQLERSESLRVAGQRALAELKSEFEALTGELVAEGQLSGGDAAAAQC